MCAAPDEVMWAQSHTLPRLSEYQKQDWQVEDGLPENNVRMIVQRPDGMLLLASASGLATFDGQRFRNLTLHGSGLIENEAVNAVLYDHAGDLWIGTDGRGVLHATRSGTVNVSELAGHLHERIRMLYEDTNGAIWIASQNGVERYVQGRIESIANTGMISGDITAPFAEDGSGGMFFVTSSGLFHWRDGVVKPYPLGNTSSDLAVAVYRDPQRRLWVGTMKHIYQLLPRTANPGERLEMPPFTPAPQATLRSPVTVMLGDPSGNLWIGTRHDGLWRLAGKDLAHWGAREGLPDEFIRSLFIDDEQDLWIGMLTGGLSRWREGALAPLGPPEGFSTTYAANALADSHGDLWLGTGDNGVFRKHNGRLLPFNPPGLRLTTPIRALAEDRKGQVWIGTWFDGVYRYDGRAYRHYLLGTESPGNAVSAILPDTQGGLWVGTYTGLFYFPSGEPDLHARRQLLDSRLITCLLEDNQGSTLVGTTAGLYRVVRGGSVELIGLPDSNIIALFADKSGYAWATTKSGTIAAVQGKKIFVVPADAGLPKFPIYSGTQDKDGHLWLGTSRGIVRAALSELHAVVEGTQTHISTVILGRADGMRSSECNGPSQPSSTTAADGTLWFATTKGFVHTTDVAEKLGNNSPVAAIAGWTTSNDPNDSPRTLDLPPDDAPIKLEAGQPDVLIFFNAKSLANPDAIEYRYRLKGYDPDWTNTRSHYARYRRLPPGSYRFEVEARFSGEKWTTPIASIQLKQSPYFYQTWYFYLMLALAAALTVALVFRRRVQLIKGRIGIVLEERNRIARECHDTLMAGFAAIAWQLEATSKLLQGDGRDSAVARPLELARNMVSHCQAEARRIIWDLRDFDEVTNLLSQALSRALLTNHTRGDIETTFEVEGKEPPLAPGCIHHLLCIGQEAYFNAIRHANPTKIAVHLRYETDSLHLAIRDDGCGILDSGHSQSRYGHFGMAVMEERARKIGGTLRVQSFVGTGTEITVKVAFNAMLNTLEADKL